MKLLVFSDVHRNKDRLIDILKTHEDADLKISLGDTELKSAFLQSYDIITIKGNYPFDSGVTYEHQITIDKKKVLLCHGHKYRVQNGIEKLYHRILETESDVAFYGHTHIAAFDKIEGKLLANPGAVSRGRGMGKDSYMTIDISGKTWLFKWFEADTHELIDEKEV